MITAQVTVSAASVLGESEVVYASTLDAGGTVPEVGAGNDRIANAQLSLSITDPALQGVFTEGAVFDVTFTPAELEPAEDTATAGETVPQLSPSDAPVADYSSPPGE